MEIGSADAYLSALIDPSVSSARLSYQVGTAVLNESLDLSEQLGDAMIKMMEQSVTPNLGGNIDVYL